ncbi:Protein of unknown function [Pelagirhabdus alkalitolerans]|uniref:DUF1659 domain-containing protein n=1 Tax=Pelagirhabdus alkalitolerans TaxID=1612202 RepID=A0A1G6KPR4_9BACI|nr:DUF1659 domain-containing protein [Pelagirhabdus alkalitolerans]SDC32964.1 Protein of unknown function [Pelagirhabdus alkalitolerans]
MPTAQRINSRLQLIFYVGTDDETGEAITQTRSFNNIKTDATASDLIHVATMLVSLQQHPLHELRRNDVELLTVS